MRPAMPPLVLLVALTSSLLCPASSVCVPRGSNYPSLASSIDPPSPSPTNSPSPSTPPTASPPTPPTPSIPTPASSPTPSGGLDEILKSLCSHTDFSDLCFKSIEEENTGLKSADTSTVLSVLMKAVDAKAHEARAFAQKLSADASTSTKTRSLLRDCIDTYDDALDNLEAANEAVRVGDTGTRDTMLSAVISNIETCEDGFQEFTIKSPMAEWSHMLQHMTDNCLAFANMDRPQGDYI